MWKHMYSVSPFFFNTLQPITMRLTGHTGATRISAFTAPPAWTHHFFLLHNTAGYYVVSEFSSILVPNFPRP